MTSTTSRTNEERRKRVYVGELPKDFLRLDVAALNESTIRQQQEAADQQAALALQQALTAIPGDRDRNRLNITIVQARLVKNYGLTRMDPYVRLRVGHCVYETQTDANGGKTPKWHKTVQTLLPDGINQIHVEIFDECSFKMDELIAWTTIPIPLQIFKGVTIEQWYNLTGKQGPNHEGTINIIMSYGVPPSLGLVSPVMMVPPNINTSKDLTPIYVQPPPQAPPLNPEDLKQVQDMFPNVDKDTVKNIFEANNGDKDLTVNSLLQMVE
ncbi:toll-interacting protein-like isoform X2 [Daktulosphaira vitifoliae]|uniref:toll-interacting protein-like isoform X2 n=1 Tax=Daktulosphaira vitifoliae TaxID=58002 RepID=UPI0021A9CED5|nr:toll-interacting protein-like isoform X2 [Daktulosphaira vitifoliae]